MRERICSLARDDCGQSIVLVSLFLVVLLGFVGLVVDAGFAFTQRRQMQNAADAAALAGARELALGGDRSAVWNTIYEYGVQRNLADTISGTFYPQGQPIKPNPGTPPTPATGVCVTTIKDLPTTFLAMFGIPSIHISAEACADEPPIQCGGGYALWAHSTSCSKTIDWTGGQWRVTGDVHSNNDLSASGNGNHANGTCEYVSDLDKQLHCTASVQGAVNMDYPVDFTIADYMPGGRAAGAAGPDYYYFASAAGFPPRLPCRMASISSTAAAPPTSARPVWPAAT